MSMVAGLPAMMPTCGHGSPGPVPLTEIAVRLPSASASAGYDLAFCLFKYPHR